MAGVMKFTVTVCSAPRRAVLNFLQFSQAVGMRTVEALLGIPELCTTVDEPVGWGRGALWTDTSFLTRGVRWN